MATTITEALAELKTLTARIGKKREFVTGILGRQEAFKDPHEKDGGSRGLIERERQAIGDLETRVVAIRSAIQLANRSNQITAGEKTKSINDWLTWRRDVAPEQKRFLATIQSHVGKIRQNAQTKGLAVNAGETAKPTDVVINVDEYALAKEIEALEEILGHLDGQLSLKNATITIEV